MKKKILVFTFLIVASGLLLFYTHRPSPEGGTKYDASEPISSDTRQTDPAVEAGKRLSRANCEGRGVSYKLSRSPMDPEDFSIVVPYGLMIDNHVTPIDHQYFTPKDYNSKLDEYEVYAMAEATIVDIEKRRKPEGYSEYRIVFSITCTYFYYYDLVTSLVPEIKETYDDYSSGLIKRLNIKVKEGQMIGRIGGQTLDFAVWDTQRPLSGFVNPENYYVEPWKIYTVDPLDYYTDELKKFVLTRYVRTAEPISGKIDYDIDGRAIGNWFLEGSGGYGGLDMGKGDYFRGHLSIAPDHIDPKGIIVSFGDFNGEPEQFLVRDPKIRPEEIGPKNGMVKYELTRFEWLTDDGSYWDRNSVAKNLKIVPSTQGDLHCFLIKLVGKRKIKAQYFTDTNCEGKNFTDKAKFYKR